MAVTDNMYGYQRTADELASLKSSTNQSEKMARAWSALLASGKPSVDGATAQVLKPLVRKGIPYEHRPAAWLWISGGSAKKTKHPTGFYKEACVATCLSQDCLFAIDRDVQGHCFQFRRHPMFVRVDGMRALRRLLIALSQRNQNDGYFHGLHDVAAFALIVMGLEAEENVFWTLSSLLDQKLFDDCSRQCCLGLKVEQDVLALLVEKKLPKIAAHLRKVECSLGVITAAWCPSLLTSLPVETTARIWDAMLLEGSKVLLRVSLALLKRFENTIIAAARPEKLRTVLDARMATLFDVDALLTCAFKGIGSLSGSALAPMRDAVRASVEREMKERRQKLEFIICSSAAPCTAPAADQIVVVNQVVHA